MNFDALNTVYFSGIGGIGMSALAQLLHDEGKTVLGSDIVKTSVTERLERKGISVQHHQTTSELPAGIDLFIHTSAVNPDNPQYKKAQELGIPTLSYFEAVGEYMKQFDMAIAVSGTHGKSTTTALIANILVRAGLDPTVIVGSIVKEFGSNARHGKKRKVIVVEACEHQAHMLHLRPSMIVLTNIEEDHLDYYTDLDHIVMTFQKYINHLPHDGVLVKNVDDSESNELDFDGRTVTYGLDAEADYTAHDIQVQDAHQVFESGDTTFELQIPGRFNVYNALAAIAACRTLGITESYLQRTLRKFTGVWRRFEVLGSYRGALVISDYAHHPTAIHSTIKAAREFYPGRRIVAVFQPHQRSRTEKLFDGFVHSFAEADFAIIQEVYDVAGREEDARVSGADLVQAVEQQGKYARFTPDIAATRQAIDDSVEPNDVLLIMGAGDIYRLAEEIAQS